MTFQAEGKEDRHKRKRSRNIQRTVNRLGKLGCSKKGVEHLVKE